MNRRTLLEVDKFAGEPTIGRGELEGRKELIDNLELISHGEDLVNHILNTDDIVLAKRVLDDGVVRDGLPLVVHIHMAALVDELANGLQVGVSVSDVRLNKTKHLDGGLVQADKGAVVNLTEAEQLEDLTGLGVNTVDTANTDHKGQLGFGLTVEVTSFLGLAAEEDLLALKGVVLLGVLLSALEVLSAVGGIARSQLEDTLSMGSLELLNSLAFLQCGFGDRNSFSIPEKKRFRRNVVPKNKQNWAFKERENYKNIFARSRKQRQ